MSRSATDSSTPPASPHQRIEELGRIIMAYSEVTDKLQQSHERLEQTVTALRDELGEKNRLLERRNRLAALGEMAAGMAHEIRNPLGGIQLYASLLSKDLSDRPEQQKLVEKIAGGVRRLEALVSQVLQFSREIRTHMVAADVKAVVQEALELSAPAVAEKSITLIVDGPASLAAEIDPLLLGQAILNLILNAVEAMPPAGTLTIRYAADQAHAKQFALTIEDTGPGIPAEIMDRIFNPFFTTRDTGTGLGLAIVHRVIEAHDGSITAANRPEGGARFEIRI